MQRHSEQKKYAIKNTERGMKNGIISNCLSGRRLLGNGKDNIRQQNRLLQQTGRPVYSAAGIRRYSGLGVDSVGACQDVAQLINSI